jgi:hypothetical protein
MRAHYFIALFIVFVISGCGFTKNEIMKTQAFGSATEKVGEFTENEFVNIREGIIQMNEELMAIDNTKTSKYFNLDFPVTADETAVRVAASKALKLYGQLLLSLVTEDRSEDYQKIAGALVDNTCIALKKDLPEEQKNAIENIIVGLGSFYVNKEKADAGREIIPLYEKPVNELADLLIEDFSLSDSSLGYLQAYYTTAKRLKNASISLVNAGDRYNVLERDRAVQAYVISEKALLRAIELNKKGREALEGLKKANTELVKVIKKQKYTTDDIIAYARQIQNVVNIYQVLAK